MKRVLLLACILAVGAFATCKKGDVQEKEKKGDSSIMQVQAAGGLRMRETPDINGRLIATIPDGSTVTVLERKEAVVEVSGKKGRWTRVSCKDQTGWVFGGFLVAGGGEGSVPAESDYEGKHLAPVLEPDEQADAVDFTLDGGKFTAKCLLHGSGEAKFEGRYEAARTGNSTTFTLRGSYRAFVVQEKEERFEGEFTDGRIRITRKNGKLFGDISLPRCDAYSKREFRTVSDR